MQNPVANNSVFQSLTLFEPISLQEMDRVKLLDRLDTKFIFHVNRLSVVLKELTEHYRILEVDGVRASRYETLYFDTEAFRLYYDHHNGKTNRYKIRYRRYVDSDLVFFEIKFKNPKGRTIKNRVKRTAISSSIEGKSQDLLKEKTPFSSNALQSKLWVNYTRITLVNKISTERLTLDLNLHVKNNQHEHSFDQIIIAEVKQEKSGISPFIKVMKQQGIRQGSISKYCFGVLSLYHEVKKNNFKPNLLNVIKISHGYKHQNIV